MAYFDLRRYLMEGNSPMEKATEREIAVFWFRRDLRMEDNTALLAALGSGNPVLPIFIFDHHILDELPEDDPRVTFIYKQLKKIHLFLLEQNSSLRVFKGDPLKVWKSLLNQYKVKAVYVNKDYEPYARQRDLEVHKVLQNKGVVFQKFKDQVIFEESEIVKNDGNPYTVFTPYKKKWLEEFRKKASLILPREDPGVVGTGGGGYLQVSSTFPSLESLGFVPSQVQVRPYDLSYLDQYAELRNVPAADATSYLSPHLRFGTLSIRKLISTLGPSNEVFLSELIWREFFMQILFHFPRVVSQSFKPKYQGIAWRNDPEDFELWCKGLTGYPMVDAGMRQLNTSGYMHNRVRMVTASFLCKHLLIDWRWGESYFARKLLDYELSSNNGNWQWAAGTGCDAAPYFRVFNPTEQQRKFDADLQYVKKWIPEYGTPDYPKPMIEHRFARNRALQSYKAGLANYLPEI